MVRFKNKEDERMIFLLKPVLISVLFGVVCPVFRREVPNYDIVVTRTIGEKIEGRSVSDTHKFGRAIDIRANNIRLEAAKRIRDELNLLLSEAIGAYSLSDKKPRFVVLEDEETLNCHFHIQIRPNLDENIVNTLISRGILFTSMNKGACGGFEYDGNN